MQDEKKNKLVIFSAPSGAGKSTIVQRLINNPDFRLEFSISACTRAPRKNEIDGTHYYFISVNDFKNKIERNEFIEWEEVYENLYYGTLKSEVNRIWENNNNVIFDIDVVGGVNIKKLYPNNSLSIFIMPPSVEELKNRLLKRGTDTEESINKRISKAEHEMTFAEKFDVTVVNDNLEEAIEKCRNLLKQFLT